MEHCRIKRRCEMYAAGLRHASRRIHARRRSRPFAIITLCQPIFLSGTMREQPPYRIGTAYYAHEAYGTSDVQHDCVFSETLPDRRYFRIAFATNRDARVGVAPSAPRSSYGQ